MNKKIRQYIGLAVAVLMYYLIHEGAHLLVALAQGVFKRINFIGLGVQIDVFAEQADGINTATVEIPKAEKTYRKQ